MAGLGVVLTCFLFIIIFFLIVFGILAFIFALITLFFLLGAFMRKKGRKIGFIFIALGVLLLLLLGYVAFVIFF